MSLEGYQIDQYRMGRLLRSGGMGEVYLAYDEHLDRQVAIKVIWTDTSRYPNIQAASDAERLFLREMQAIARLDHNNILPVYGSGEISIDGTKLMFMVMPYRRQGSLADWLREHKPARLLSLKDVERILIQAASALQHAHNHHIVHRDVKPSNLLIQGEAMEASQLNLQLADFGVAKLMTTTSESQIIRGTPSYMAPEQWDGEPVPATDQYALAVMTYELLTGNPPFIANNNHQMWHLHCHVQPRPLRAINPAVPLALDAVVLRALEKNPDDRYSSVMAFARAFQQALLKSANKSIAEVAAPDIAPQVVPMVPGRQKRGFGGKAIFIICLALALIASSLGTFFILRASQQENINSTPVIDTATTHITSTHMTTGAVNTTATAQTNETDTAQTNTTVQINVTATTQANATATSQTMTTATAIANAKVTATAQAIATVYATAVTPGNPILNDPLQNNNQGNNWDTGSTATAGDGSCVFIGGGYHSKPLQIGSFAPCFAQATSFSNFSFQVQMTIVQGDQGGIIFRANKSNGTFYYFHINRNGSFALEVYDHFNLTGVIQNGSSPAIQTGLNQTNLLAVVASNNNLILYVNKQQIASVSDNTYAEGQIGVIAESIQNPTDIGFNNAQVWLR